MSTPTEVAALVTATNNLTQTVIDKRTEITNTVATKIQQLDNWKNNLTPVSIGAEPRYVSAIDLTGLPTNRYYPVWWSPPNNKAGAKKITITRYRADDSGLDPFNDGVASVAGLHLEMEQVDRANRVPNYLRVHYLFQMYRNTVRQIALGMRCSSVQPVDGQLTDNSYVQNKIHPYRSGLYLRGGLTYTVISNYYQALNYSREDAEVEVSISAPSTAIKGRWMAKSYVATDPFLGGEYDNFTAPANDFPYPV